MTLVNITRAEKGLLSISNTTALE